MQIITKKLPFEYYASIKDLFQAENQRGSMKKFLALLNKEYETNFDDVEVGMLNPPTVFIQAGYKPTFILFIFQNDVNLYVGGSPNPTCTGVRIDPFRRLEENSMNVFFDYTLNMFAIEPDDWDKCEYILIRQSDN